MAKTLLSENNMIIKIKMLSGRAQAREVEEDYYPRKRDSKLKTFL